MILELKWLSVLEIHLKNHKDVSPSLSPNLAPNAIVLLKPLPVQHPLLSTSDPARAHLVNIKTHDTVFRAGVLLHVHRDGAVGGRLPH